jgi:thiosulfate/3-mercaptopyruvate sulfurtransferase
VSGRQRINPGRGLVLLFIALVWPLTLPSGAGARPQGDYAHPEMLLSAQELKARLDQKDPNLRLIDFRHKAKYYLGHIPGAIQMWRRAVMGRGPVPGLPPPRAQLEKLLGHLGVGSKNTLVIYSDQCDHTHLWWLLAYYGFPLDRLQLLDGGFEAWKAKDYPTQLTSPRLKAATFKFPGETRKGLLATLGDIKEALGPPANRIILDVRTQDQYRGERTREGAGRRGHIPGALWINWAVARVPEGPDKGCWKSAAEIKQIYQSQGVTPDKDIVIYSHNDLCATYTLVSLYLAGYPLERLHVYGGSWMEWSKSSEPVETGGRGPAR